MDFLLNNWYFIVLIVAVIGVAAAYCYKFFKLPTDAQLSKVQEWLLWAVAQAEKAFGSKTGQLKLRYTYDLFLNRFPQIATLITFQTFSTMVDKALEKFNNMLQSNKQVEGYVNATPTVVVIEKKEENNE